TDVYNLGAAMYWILTNTFVPTALGKEDSLVGSIDDSVMPRPKNVRELNPRVPEALGELVMQCVEVDPEARPTMETVADKLNLIRSRIVAERALRKSGMLPKVSGGKDSSKAGTKSGSKLGPDLLSGSKAGANNGQAPELHHPRHHHKSPPPVDP